ncbi:MAG: DUF5690 family protein [Cytophagales bacterium]|nr:DUF5690 family protein [Cytophagales bacterium]
MNEQNRVSLHPITRWLVQTKPWIFNLYTGSIALLTYSCMYAFRKPFTAATYEGLSFLGTDLKIWFITAQVVGYALSKFFGIKVISEMKHGIRALLIIAIVGLAEVSLLFFGIVQGPLKIVFMFLNGVPLGMVWGIVFSYLEGRKTTEFLGAMLCISFIFSSGFVKSVGKWLLLSFNISEYWMPFFTGAIFILPLLGSLYLLDKVPEPSVQDKAQREKRVPMNREERWSLFKKFALPLVMLIITYMTLTAFRDFRDNFSAEMWQYLGYGDSPEIFTLTEIPIAIIVMIVMTTVMFVKNNKRALYFNHLIILAGLLSVGLSTVFFDLNLLSEVHWMILIGLGLYLGYVPFNSIFFDRFIAAFKAKANVGFLIYLADSFGYLASVFVLFYKNFGHAQMEWIDFFRFGAYLLCAVGLLLVLFSILFFRLRFKSIN